MNCRISRLEQKLDSETKALAAQCEGLERELTFIKAALKRGETSRKEAVQKKEQKGKETALSKAFSGKDLGIMASGVEALKQGTGKGSATIVYDSTVDPFTDIGIFDKVEGRRNSALVDFTTSGDVFGGFYGVAVTERYKEFYDSNIFAFSFESHRRCETPQRFVVMEGKKTKANVFFDNIWGFVQFKVDGAGALFLGNEMSRSYCENMSDAFERVQDTTLTGRNGRIWGKGPDRHCARLVAVQLSSLDFSSHTLNHKVSLETW